MGRKTSEWTSIITTASTGGRKKTKGGTHIHTHIRPVDETILVFDQLKLAYCIFNDQRVRAVSANNRNTSTPSARTRTYIHT